MELKLSIDLIRWIDANRCHRSRQAYIAKLIRDAMETDTLKEILIKNDQIPITDAIRSNSHKD